MTIIQTKKLTKYYGNAKNCVRALDGVDLEIEQSSFTAVVGTSGSGKTTLLNMLGALDTPTSGSVLVEGRELSGMTREQRAIFRRRRVGFIFQDYNLIPTLNVYENIVFPLDLDHSRIDTKMVGEIVELLKLKDRLGAFPHELSGGQQQRVAIARALAVKPAIVLADEPTGNLDSRTSQDVMGLLRSMSDRFRQTLVMITHNEDIAQTADRLIRIEDGKIIPAGGNGNVPEQ
ncbi:ABC transporter ATP-binding protein [Diplocloster agilis]|uniref:ABC transporter ATP-binding protein n=1 Tax=Diplocloster agilis TaxID=2850323 RepID=A0A949K5X1_9FIRM|nr:MULTISPECIES: ABC transporter ATP-binding protein [Lachnospiraceae]MBU9735382.1 ABC transporter ATP-binding protein [Diplocloster agilis]MBU9743423.1 ABC transporter ATP-binding protein [Diplocloster agilis]MCU6733890.1 ABC transporter ATP-binding protein [Suonthocola fibrivorans]SCJ14062.1 Macrolide export ATP-binding/permease protein MacB [uncultured Clostridium sp.]